MPKIFSEQEREMIHKKLLYAETETVIPYCNFQILFLKHFCISGLVISHLIIPPIIFELLSVILVMKSSHTVPPDSFFPIPEFIPHILS